MYTVIPTPTFGCDIHLCDVLCDEPFQSIRERQQENTFTASAQIVILYKYQDFEA